MSNLTTRLAAMVSSITKEEPTVVDTMFVGSRQVPCLDLGTSIIGEGDDATTLKVIAVPVSGTAPNGLRVPYQTASDAKKSVVSIYDLAKANGMVVKPSNEVLTAAATQAAMAEIARDEMRAKLGASILKWSAKSGHANTADVIHSRKLFVSIADDVMELNKLLKNHVEDVLRLAEAIEKRDEAELSDTLKKARAETVKTIRKGIVTALRPKDDDAS